MGLFLMESLRIMRLFPVIDALNDKLWVRMICQPVPCYVVRVRRLLLPQILPGL